MHADLQLFIIIFRPKGASEIDGVNKSLMTTDPGSEPYYNLLILVA